MEGRETRGVLKQKEGRLKKGHGVRETGTAGKGTKRIFARLPYTFFHWEKRKGGVTWPKRMDSV